MNGLMLLVDKTERVPEELPLSMSPPARSSRRLAPVQVTRSSELVAAQLRRMVIRGELTEGEALPPESELIEAFQISRPTMREAMRILEAEGLITVQRGMKGGPRIRLPSVEIAARYAGFVLQHSGTTYHDITEARAILEAHCVALLAEHRTDGQLQALRASLADPRPADVEQAARSYAEFHTLVAELAGNDTLALFTRMANTIFENGVRHQLAHAAGGDPAEHRRLHEGARHTHAKLVDLIDAKDAAGASALWRKHIYDEEDLMANTIDLDEVFEVLS